MATQPTLDKAVDDLKRDPARPVRVRVGAMEVELRVVQGSTRPLGASLAALGPWAGESEDELLKRLREARTTGGSLPAPDL